MSFWVALDEDEEPSGNWRDWEGRTELGNERLCRACGEEF